MGEHGRLSLAALFEAQAEFQRHIDAHPEDMDTPERIDHIVYMKTALENELHEMLQEIGWKPWATSRHINYEAAKSELRDAFQFFMNLCFALRMDSTELIEGTFDKLETNYERANRGYDGVSTKCAWCGRALDDKNVSCEPPGESATMGIAWCSQKNQEDEADGGFFTSKELEARK